MDRHQEFMARAIEISKERMEGGFGGPFGAVIVKDGEIVAEGYNQVTSANDPTAHAEISAIRAACDKLETFDLSGCDIYTSCEPCPMCLAAIYWAHCDHIYYANTREHAAHIGFDDAHIYDEIPKAHADRSLPIIHLPSEEALAAFQAWEDKTDKILY
jgi:guanine deaminase